MIKFLNATVALHAVHRTMIRLWRAPCRPIDLTGAAKGCFHQMGTLSCKQHMVSKRVARIGVIRYRLLPGNNPWVRQGSARQEVVDTKPRKQMEKLQEFRISLGKH